MGGGYILPPSLIFKTFKNTLGGAGKISKTKPVHSMNLSPMMLPVCQQACLSAPGIPTLQAWLMQRECYVSHSRLVGSGCSLEDGAFGESGHVASRLGSTLIFIVRNRPFGRHMAALIHDSHVDLTAAESESRFTLGFQGREENFTEACGCLHA